MRYAIIDSRNHNLLVLYDRSLREMTDREKSLNTIFVEEEDLQQSFNRVDISIWSEYFTLIPSEIWQEGQEAEIVELVYGTTEGHCQSMEFFDGQLTAAYCLDPKVERWFREHFPKAHIQHSSIPLLNHYRKLNANNGKSKVYVHFQEHVLEVTMIRDGQLKFHNHFHYESKEDVAYFILLVYDQLELSREAVPLILGGGIVQDSAVYQLLYRYISEIQFARIPKQIVIKDKVYDSMQRHDFVNLLSMIT